MKGEGGRGDGIGCFRGIVGDIGHGRCYLQGDEWVAEFGVVII